MNVVATSGRPRPRLLVCLDLQQANAPLEGDAEAEHVLLQLANCRRILEHARAWGWDIVHVHRRHCEGGLSRPIPGLEPRPCEPVMSRDGVSAFSCRSFRELVDGALDAEIVLIGFCLASSCLATLFAAHDRGLSTLVVEDAVAAAPNSAAGVEPVARSIVATFARVVPTEQLVGRRPAPRLVVV
jgi:nicotinamidase-related amidase